ncbi:MAG: hypothetical protein CMJ46_08130 [Planctomyces sp.]|nr:hypothetical protein [Planctomyces sp.]
MAGIGDSTFRTEETQVNNNNNFDFVISDFDDLFFRPGGPAPFGWTTGIVLPVDFPQPAPIAVP